MWVDPYESYPFDASVTTTADKHPIHYAERIPWRVGVGILGRPYLSPCGLLDLVPNKVCTHPGFVAEVIDFIARVRVCRMHYETFF